MASILLCTYFKYGYQFEEGKELGCDRQVLKCLIQNGTVSPLICTDVSNIITRCQQENKHYEPILVSKKDVHMCCFMIPPSRG